jgi:thiol-disulfide isomerase/thioredoxin
MAIQVLSPARGGCRDKTDLNPNRIVSRGGIDHTWERIDGATPFTFFFDRAFLMSYRFLLAFVFLLGSGTWALAQEEPKLPDDPAQWINGGPITQDMLKGKAAFLWFYEEQCPRCREKWPALVALSKQFEEQAIVFIAVNSGNSREAVEAYAKEVKLPWPVIVDSTRELEQKCVGNEISLQNIMQVKLVLPDGTFRNGEWGDPQKSATEAAKDAKWSGDISKVPAPLLPAWRGLQFGLFQKAAGPISAGLASADPAEKAMAEKLNAYVQGKIAGQMQIAKDAHRSGEKWKSYKIVTALPSQFAGYTMPEGVAKAKAALAAEEAVRMEIAARSELESLKKRARTTVNPVAMQGLLKKLKEFTEKYGDTEAGAEGQTLLASAPAGN